MATKNAIRAILPDKYLMQRYVRKQLKKGEPELRIVPLLCCRSEISIDVGANYGVYSFLFSLHSDHVIAVEPHPRLADRLKRLLPPSVNVLNIAASNEDGVSELHIPTVDGTEIHSRSSLEADVNREMVNRTVRVEKRRLDRLPLGGRLVAVIKIDVEGHELNALQGLADILEKSKPTIIVESEARHHAGAPYDVFDFLETFGYQAYFVYRGKLWPKSEFSVEKFQAAFAAKEVFNERSPDYVNNFIFVHPSRRAVLDRVELVYPSAIAQSPIGPAA